jgi:DNA primase
MPESSLQELKQHPKILDLYRAKLSLKQDGRRWRGPCPFHSDKHATNFDIWLHENTYIYKCLSCGASGDIFKLLQQTDNCDFRASVGIVRNYCSEWSQNAEKVSQVFKPIGQEESKVRKTYSLEEYGRLENALKNSPEAQSFLRSRGISMETAQRLRIGFRQDVGKLAGESNADVAGRGWLAFPTFVRSDDVPSKPLVTGIKYRSIVRKAFSRQPGMNTALFNLES